MRVFTLTEMNISNSLFDSVEGAGAEYGPFQPLMWSQLLIDLWWSGRQRHRLVEHTLGRGLIGPVAVQTSIVRAKTRVAIRRRRVAVAGHIVNGRQGVIRAAVRGRGRVGVMGLLLLCWVAVRRRGRDAGFLASDTLLEFAIGLDVTLGVGFGECCATSFVSQ